MKIGTDNQLAKMLRRTTLGWTYGVKTNIPIKLNIKYFNKCILPLLTYGAETLTLTKANENDGRWTKKILEWRPRADKRSNVVQQWTE